jgi:butyrate kinase
VRAAEPLITARLQALREEDPLYGSINIVTEMRISVALSEAAARTKLGEQYAELRGAGKASLLVVPNLDVGNLLYHIYATRYPGAASTLIIGGLRDQALDFSRSSGVEEIVRGAEALLLRRFRSDPRVRTRDDHFFPRYRVLTINPGSTSTKVALWEGDDLVARSDVGHIPESLGMCKTLMEQLPMRRQVVERFLAKIGCDVKGLAAVVGRGGLMRPVESGTFRVDDAMVADLSAGVSGSHPSNLGAVIAREIADAAGVPAFTVDPPVVDELDDTSRITGYRESEQEAAWHALSQKAAAKHFGDQHNRDYETLNLIVAHLGGGISVGSHRKGRCVRVKNALYDGPMSPNRAGTLPGLDLITFCYSGMERVELERRLIGQGGLMSYLGTDDLREVEKRIAAGDGRAAQVFEAMIEQIACEIGSHVPKFKGESIDQILLTGGLCHSATLCERLRCDLAGLGIPISVYPGEREMEALRDGALRVLRGLEEAESYRPLRDQL